MRALLLLCGCLGCGGPITPAPALYAHGPPPSLQALDAGTLRITALAIGQGDATLVEFPDGTTLLIDGGPPGSLPILEEALATRQIDRPDYTLATHYDLDHIGGLVEYLIGPDATPATADDRLPRIACFDRGAPAETPATWSSKTYLTIRSGCTHTLTAGETLPIGGAALTLLAVNGTFADGTQIAIDPDDENAHSMVLQVTYGATTYLHMGDLPGGGGIPPYQTINLESPLAPLAGDVDVLHVSHHGSRTATNDTLLVLTTPDTAIISVGPNNDFGHPHAEVLARLKKHGIAIFTTLTHHIVSESNGATITEEFSL
ncbi:MAG: MBL fold metallo-hydrolase [Deltaproteobacteria bacterium]|nr:MBL fold metallo-hydrolase [Deltaproteobacteria bacterium]